MANAELLPKGDYKVKVVGPARDWEFTGDKGTVKMATDSIQFEGYEQYWVDVNRSQDKPAPKIGETLKGHIEQDDAGKFPPKFKKESGGGGGYRGGGGGGQASPGAIWSSAVSNATAIVVGFYTVSGTKPTDIKEFIGKIKKLTPVVNKMVDGFVAGAKPAPAPAADTTTSESGESPAPAAAPAPAAKPAAVIEDIDDEELGDW